MLILFLASTLATSNCDDLCDFLMENELCPIDFPPYGYLYWESSLNLRDECADDIHWWLGVNRECCYARQPLGPWRTKVHTVPKTKSSSRDNTMSSNPCGILQSPVGTSKEPNTQSSNEIPLPGTKTLAGSLGISPPKNSEDSKSYTSAASNSSSALVEIVLCVLSLGLLCVLAACFVIAKRKKRIGNEPPKENLRESRPVAV
jgi:hypothetical protein